MAKPIKPTPVLSGDDAEIFLRRMASKRRPVLNVTAPPSLERAKKAVFGTVPTAN